MNAYNACDVQVRGLGESPDGFLNTFRNNYWHELGHAVYLFETRNGGYDSLEDDRNGIMFDNRSRLPTTPGPVPPLKYYHWKDENTRGPRLW